MHGEGNRYRKILTLCLVWFLYCICSTLLPLLLQLSASHMNVWSHNLPQSSTDEGEKAKPNLQNKSFSSLYIYFSSMSHKIYFKTSVSLAIFDFPSGHENPVTIRNILCHKQMSACLWQKLGLMHLLSMRVNINTPGAQEGAEQSGSMTMKKRRGQWEAAVTQPFPSQRNKQLNASWVLTWFSR